MVLLGRWALNLPLPQHPVKSTEEALGHPDCLRKKTQRSFSGDLYRLATMTGLTHAQWTDANQGQIAHYRQSPPSPWYYQWPRNERYPQGES